MEANAVIEVAVGELLEVLDGLWGFTGEEFRNDGAFGGFECGQLGHDFSD